MEMFYIYITFRVMVVLLGCIHSLKFISCTPKNGNISLYVNYMSIKQTLRRLKFYNVSLTRIFRNTNSIKWERNTQQLLQILFTRQQGFHLKPSYSNCGPEIRSIKQHCPESFLEMQTLRSQPRSTESEYVYYQELQVSPMYNTLSICSLLLLQHIKKTINHRTHLSI